MTGFQALRCYSCSMMQVKQARKSSRWTCSICNEKQSQMTVYAISITAKELRQFVQDFNLSHHSAADAAAWRIAQQPREDGSYRSSADPKQNKWLKYLPDKNQDDAGKNAAHSKPEDLRYATEMPQTRSGGKRKSVTSDIEDEDSPAASIPRLGQTKLRPGNVTNPGARLSFYREQPATKWAAYLSDDDNC